MVMTPPERLRITACRQQYHQTRRATNLKEVLIDFDHQMQGPLGFLAADTFLV
jgi:hypothetical protein